MPLDLFFTSHPPRDKQFEMEAREAYRRFNWQSKFDRNNQVQEWRAAKSRGETITPIQQSILDARKRICALKSNQTRQGLARKYANIARNEPIKVYGGYSTTSGARATSTKRSFGQHK